MNAPAENSCVNKGNKQLFVKRQSEFVQFTSFDNLYAKKYLIRDVINLRCGKNPLIGWPHKITTVDEYQGQQNDFVLISLVRTKAVGHLRDVRRLVVAMSRARLGLYVFGRVSLFKNCFELCPTLELLTKHPQALEIIPDEAFPATRSSGDLVDDSQSKKINSMSEMAEYVYNLYMSKLQALQEQMSDVEQIYYSLPQEAEMMDPDSADVAVEDDNDDGEEMIHKVIEPVQEAKKKPKAAATKEHEKFKQTPIINEIDEPEA